MERSGGKCCESCSDTLIILLMNHTMLPVQVLREESDNFLSLNGMWRFNWVGNADQRPDDFYQLGYNDSAWMN